MAFPRKLADLCTPSLIYFVISMVAFVSMIFLNFGNTHHYTLGAMTVPVPDTTVIFILKFIYILFWTWILNLMCKDGHAGIAWFLVLLPFVLFLLIMLYAPMMLK